MAVADAEYFARRAEEERDAAVRAKDMASFRAHMGMSREYDRRARGFGSSHADQVVLR